MVSFFNMSLMTTSLLLIYWSLMFQLCVRYVCLCFPCDAFILQSYG